MRNSNMRRACLAATLSFSAAIGAALPLSGAKAGLLGSGRTVQAFYYNGVFVGPEGEINAVTGNSLPSSLTAAVNFQQGAADGSTINVADTKITITNVLAGNAPFCLLNTPGTACVDQIDGFDFKFTGENILGVSLDAATAADFTPVIGSFQGNAHLGLQLIGPNEVRVDVTGDAPALNDKLIIDLSFATIAPIPEPASLALLGAGLLGLASMRRTKKARA